MAKQLIHAYVDAHVYLALKSKEINLSATVNECLTNYLDATETDADETMLEGELKEIQIRMTQLAKELSKKSAELASSRTRRQREQKEEWDIKTRMMESAKLNNPLRDN